MGEIMLCFLNLSNFNFEILRKSIIRFGNNSKYEILKNHKSKLKTQIIKLYEIYDLIRSKNFINEQKITIPKYFN